MSFRHAAGDENTFACRQPGSLDDHGMGNMIKIGMGFSNLIEDGVPGGGNGMPRHEILGKTFGCFNLRSCAGWTKHGNACLPQGITQPGFQGGFGTDDNQVHPFALCITHQVIHCHSRNGNVVRMKGGAGVARRADEPAQPGALGDFPCQGMLPSARANHQDSQTLCFHAGSPSGFSKPVFATWASTGNGYCPVKQALQYPLLRPMAFIIPSRER